MHNYVKEKKDDKMLIHRTAISMHHMNLGT